MNKPNHPPIVVDNRVLLYSALSPSSKSARTLELVGKHFVIAQSQECWQDLILRFRHPSILALIPEAQQIQFLTTFARQMLFVSDLTPTDPIDDRWVRLAIASGAKIIISTCPTLLTIQSYRHIDIFSPDEFFDHYHD